MTRIRNDRTRRQRRRAGTTLVLAAAAGGLLAAAMAGSPSARADDLADIVSDVQASIGAGEGDFSVAGTDFSGGDTSAGLFAAFAGFDNTIIAPADYTLVGLTGEATGVDIGGIAGNFLTSDVAPLGTLTQAAQENIATSDFSLASEYFTAAPSDFSGGGYTDGVFALAASGYLDIVGGEADILGALFGAGF